MCERNNMPEVEKTEQKGGQGLAIAALVLGILAIVTALAWFIAVVLGVLAIIFGAVSLKSQGRGKAIAGIITGSIGIVISLLLVFVVLAALPSLQGSARDTARKSDVSSLTSSVLDYQTNNSGKLPAAADLSASGLVQVKTLAGEGAPTTESAVYVTGKDCDGAASARAYSVSVLLENGSTYCLGS